MSIQELIEAEGWEVVFENDNYFVRVNEQLIPYNHPVAIHLKLYREATNSEIKYNHMKAAYHYLWPDAIWNYWTEERFRAHCEDRFIITMASGANCGKSFDIAYIAAIFWLSNPQKNAVVIASVTQESLKGRVWGYLTNAIRSMAVPMPYKYLKSPSPHFLYDDGEKVKKGKIEDDTLHGIFAVTAKLGDDYKTIATWIGRHPIEKMLVILDEATDMPISILQAVPNLAAKKERFQMWSLGNSSSKFDLHGSLATPRDGWDSIDPKTATRWNTMHDNSICLYFSPYNSPAIHEKDPVKKAQLAHFLITTEGFASKIKEYGEESEGFWRFVLGFWRADASGTVVISIKLLDEFNPRVVAHWSGIYPIRLVASLDPAFSTKGDNAIFRVGSLGHTTDGRMKLDMHRGETMHYLKITPLSKDSAELQLCKQVIHLMAHYRIPYNALAVDVTGQGRAFVELLKVQAKVIEQPHKIWTIQEGQKSVNAFDVIPLSNFTLYTRLRSFIQNSQICGLDDITIIQVTQRLIELKGHKQVLESKQSFKARMGAIMPSLARSPDESDTAVLLVQAAVLTYGFYEGQNLGPINTQRTYEEDKMDAHKAGLMGGNVNGYGERREQEIPRATYSSSVESFGAIKRLI